MRAILKDFKINNYKSFNPIEADMGYRLDNNKKYRKYTTVALQKLHQSIRNDRIRIAMRGVAKDDWFRDFELYKFFVVGEKGKWYMAEMAKEFYATQNTTKVDLITEVNKLTSEINEIITERKAKHPINGSVDSVDHSFSVEELEKRKMLLITVLHNIGNRWHEKENSPCMSLSVGDDAPNVAFKFCRPHTNDEIGFIFVYFVHQDSEYYMETRQMNLILKELGVDWYEDIHSEWIMIDGVLPHQLLGILEITNYENKEADFILNPWLAHQIEKYEFFWPSNGIFIDQSEFEKYAAELGYKRFYTQIEFEGKVNRTRTNIKEALEKRMNRRNNR